MVGHGADGQADTRRRSAQKVCKPVAGSLAVKSKYATEAAVGRLKILHLQHIGSELYSVSTSIDRDGVVCVVIVRRVLDRVLCAVSESHITPVSYTHLRAHETGRNLVC